MGRLAEQFPFRAASRVRDLAVAVARAEIWIAPFDTGAAKFSWVINVGSPDYPNFYDGQSYGSQSAVESQAIAAAEDKAERITAMPGAPIFLTNAVQDEGVAYLIRLNTGGSRTVAAGFIDDTLHETIATFFASAPPILKGL